MRNWVSILLTAVLVLWGAVAQSQEEMLIPKLDDHTFVLNPLVPAPFVNSSFQMRIGYESSVGIDFPPIFDILPDSIKGLDGSLVFVTLGFTYQQKIKDWIGFYANIGGAVRSGTDLGSLVFEGVNTVVGGETGLVFNILERPKHKLGGRFMLSNYNATIIDFRQFIVDLIEGIPDPSVTKNAPALNVGVGLNYAYAISPIFGVTGLTEMHYGESITRGDEFFRLRVGVAGDANFAPKGVPLGLSLGYMVRSTPDYVFVDNQIAHTFNLVLSYTGEEDLLIGFDFAQSYLPVNSLNSNIRTAGININLIYFFN